MRQIIFTIEKQLKHLYDPREAHSIAKLILEYVLGIPYSQVHTYTDTNINKIQLNKITSITEDLASGCPIQYILGESEFYNLKFEVNKHTLIPRPETEELVDLVLKNHNTSPLSLLDVGTGSGCIPIALKYNRPNWKIHSLDISPKAIATAKRNALTNLKPEHPILFERGDILNWQQIESLSIYDIIISNPPYVLQSEKSLMHSRVLDYEPHLALFVSDQSPLLFYEKILQCAQVHLKDTGKLYFEINECKGNDIINLSHSLGFKEVVVMKDLNQKDRMVSIQRG